MSQNCPECNAACLQKVSDACTVWSGPDIPALGIKKGDYYNDAMTQFATKFVELSEVLIDVSATNDGTCDNCSDKLPLVQAVQRMSNTLSNLKASSIKVDVNTKNLGNNALSHDGSKLLNRTASYFVQEATSGSLVGFDLTSAISNLPTDYQLVRTNVTVMGERKFGSTVLTNSTLPTFSIKVANDRYPLDVDIDIKINTPNGTVGLLGTFNIDSPKVMSTVVSLKVQDGGKNAGEELLLSDFIKLTTAQMFENKSEINQLNNLNVTGYENIPLSSTKAPNVINTLLSKVSSLLTSVDDLSTVNFDNSGSSVKGTPQDITALISSKLNKMTSDLSAVVTDIKNINDRLNSLSESNITLLSQGGGAVTGSSTGGSGSNAGGCPGGNCG